jgi:hypothetical protein
MESPPGQAEALPDMPYRGDVFRALHTATPLVRYLDHRGYDAIAVCNRLHERQARRQHRQGRKDRSLAAQLRYAREAEILAVTLADEVAALIGWLRQDILRGVGRGLRLTAARDRGTLAAAAVHARPSEQDAVDLAASGQRNGGVWRAGRLAPRVWRAAGTEEGQRFGVSQRGVGKNAVAVGDRGAILTGARFANGCPFLSAAEELVRCSDAPEGFTPRGLGFGVGKGSGSPGCSEQTFGHTGSTGTLCWADPASETICVVLTSLPRRAVKRHPRELAAERVAVVAHR